MIKQCIEEYTRVVITQLTSYYNSTSRNVRNKVRRQYCRELEDRNSNFNRFGIKGFIKT